jgi:hypothetical protein
MNTAVDFVSNQANVGYLVYAKAANIENRYYPWDNIQFKTKEIAEKHLKHESVGNIDWYDRLVVVRVSMEIVS